MRISEGIYEFVDGKSLHRGGSVLTDPLAAHFINIVRAAYYGIDLELVETVLFAHKASLALPLPMVRPSLSSELARASIIAKMSGPRECLIAVGERSLTINFRDWLAPELFTVFQGILLRCGMRIVVDAVSIWHARAGFDPEDLRWGLSRELNALISAVEHAARPVPAD